MVTAVELKNVTKTYGKGDKRVQAVKDTSLALAKGKITALLGPNGSGKSTLIKSICGLVEVNSGTVLIDGKDVATHPSLLKNIGCILEGERNIYYYLTVHDNLYYFGKLNRIRRVVLKKRIDAVLEQLNLQHKRDAYVSTLSRGMQQKVALASLLIRDPDILLLDEPTLGLDVQSSLQLTDYLLHLCQHEEKTVLLTTHQLDLAERIADHIVLYRDGEVLLDGQKEDVLRHVDDDLYVAISFQSTVTAAALAPLKSFGEATFEGLPTIVVRQEQVPALMQQCAALQLEIVELKSVQKNLQELFLEWTR